MTRTVHFDLELSVADDAVDLDAAAEVLLDYLAGDVDWRDIGVVSIDAVTAPTDWRKFAHDYLDGAHDAAQ